MILVDNFDDTDFNLPKPAVEIHQTVRSLNTTLYNCTKSTSTFSKDQFQEPFHTSTTLQTPEEKKIEALVERKLQLFRRRETTYNSLLYRYLRIGYRSIRSIDKELDQIERTIISLKQPNIQARSSQTNDLLRKTSSNILKYKLAIQNTKNGPSQT